jgi:hypothetical protein
MHLIPNKADLPNIVPDVKKCITIYIYVCVYNSLFNLKAIFGIFTPYEPSFTVRSLQFIQIPSLVVQPGAQQKQLQVDLHQASQTPSKMAVTSHHWLLVGTPTPLKKLME